MSMFEKEIADFQMEEGNNQKYQLGIMDIFNVYSNQRMTDFVLDKDDSEIGIVDMKSVDSHIYMRVNNMSLNFLLDFDMHSEPEWIKDKGSGKINL